MRTMQRHGSGGQLCCLSARPLLLQQRSCSRWCGPRSCCSANSGARHPAACSLVTSYTRRRASNARRRRRRRCTRSCPGRHAARGGYKVLHAFSAGTADQSRPCAVAACTGGAASSWRGASAMLRRLRQLRRRPFHGHAPQCRHLPTGCALCCVPKVRRRRGWRQHPPHGVSGTNQAKVAVLSPLHAVASFRRRWCERLLVQEMVLPHAT